MSFRVSGEVSLGFHVCFFRLIYGSFRAHLGFHVRVSYEEFLSGFLEVFFGFHLGSLGF